MTAVRVALRVEVVAEEIQTQIRTKLGQCIVSLRRKGGEHGRTGAILLEEVLKPITFSGRVLRVRANIEV